MDDTLSANLILQSINDAVIAISPQRYIQTWNAAAERIYGWQAADVIGQNLDDILPVERYLDGQATDDVERAFYDQGYWHGLVLNRHRDGHLLMIDASVRLLRHPDGTPQNLIAINRDVTARMQAEAQAQASEARYAAQYHGSPIPILTWQAVDDDFIMLDLNPAALILTQGAAFLRGSHARLLYREQPQVREDLIHCFREQVTVHRETWWTLQSTGQQHYLAVTCVPIGADLIMTYIVDRTERQRLEEERERLLEETTAALAARDQFLNIASHELRTPLTPIFGYLNLLHVQLTEPAQQAMMDIVLRKFAQLTTLVTSLLDAERLRHGPFMFDVHSIDFAALATQVVEDVRLTLPGPHFQLQQHIPEQAVPIRANAVFLEQAIQNLLSNAIKYSPYGGSIEVRVEQRGAEAVLEIHDEGIGIPAEEVPRIFERFFRGNGGDIQADGLGIGLYIVQQIVQHHGGSIDVESSEGQGTTMRVVLPAEHPMQPDLNMN